MSSLIDFYKSKLAPALKTLSTVASSAGKEFIEAPKSFGGGINTLLSRPFESARLDKERQTDALLQDILNRRGKTEQARAYSQRVPNQMQNNLGVNAISQARKNVIGGGTRTALQLGGLTSSALLPTALFGGTLSGAMSAIGGGNVAEDIGKGIGSAPKFAGLNKLTSPVIDPVVHGLGVAKPLVQKLVTRGGVQGIANILEDELYTRLAEQRTPSGQERVFSGVMGAVSSPLNKFDPEKSFLEIVNGKVKINKEILRNKIGQFAKPNTGVPKIDKVVSEWESKANQPVKVNDGKGGYEIIPQWRAVQRGQGFNLGLGVKDVNEGKVDPLLSEASKYKSAEEFVNSQRRVYHQTTPEIAKKIESEGFRTDIKTHSSGDFIPEGVSTKSTPDQIGLNAKGSQIERFVNKNSKILETIDRNDYYKRIRELDTNDEFAKAVFEQKDIDKVYGKKVDELGQWKQGMSDEEYKKRLNDSKKLINEWKKAYDVAGNKASKIATKLLKENGYDGVYIKYDTGGMFGKLSTDNLVIIDPKKLQTKSQLTDIYNQAKGVEPTKVTPVRKPLTEVYKEKLTSPIQVRAVKPLQNLQQSTLATNLDQTASIEPKLSKIAKTLKSIPRTDDSIILVQQAIDSGDIEAGKALYNSIEGKKPSFESLVNEVEATKVKPTIPGEYGDHQDIVNEFKKLLRRKGEKVSPGGELYREHIPVKELGMSSDEVASELGMTESEFMAQITKDLQMAGEGKATPVQITRLNNNVVKIKNLLSKLKTGKEVVPYKDEIGKTIGVGVSPSEATLAKQSVADTKLKEKQAKLDYGNWSKSLFKQEGATQTTTGAINQASKAVKTSTTSPISNPNELKDLSGFKAWTKDIYRNFKEVYGGKYEQVKSMVLDPFDKSKGQMVDDLKTWTTDLKKNVVDKFNIQKGSKESSAIQQFGEGKRTLDSLVSEFGEARAKQIVESDKWFRGAYDNLLSQVNAVRARIYPGQADKIIPRRSDYYRHFTEIADGVRGLLNIFDNPSNISSSLAGTSEFVKPKSKWLSFAQKRLGERTQEDAVGGFLDYLKAQTYAKNIDPHIARFRSLSDEIAQNTAEGANAGKMNGFIEYLQDFANDLSGKTNPADRFIQKIIPGGRKTMGVLNWLNSRVKANTIVGNVSSTIAQIFNVPQGIANAGVKNATTGLGRTIGDIFNEGAVSKSNFINERYSDKLIRQFDSRLIDQPKKLAVWMTGVLDNVGTRYIWNMHYDKALSEGIKNPIKYADDITRKLVAGRGVGETPLIQKSKLFQLVSPFTLEVGNLWHVMGDWVDAKQFGKLAIFFVVSHIFNKGAEAIRGSDVNIDPIQASMDAYKAYQEEENKKVGALRAGGRLAGEVISNIPLAGKVAEVYPEYGMKIGGENVTRKELFGEGDPTRFGSGLLAQQAITDPLYKLVPSFGGQQLKRTIEGVQATKKGYSESKGGKVQFTTENTPVRNVQRAVFGKYSTPEAREYFDKSRTALGDKQSEIVKSSPDKKSAYNKIIVKREEDSAIEKARESLKSSNQTVSKVGKVYLLKQPDGSVDKIDISSPISEPTLTNNTELDKKLISKYKGQLTSRANDIVKLYQAGEITSQEAEKMIVELQGKTKKYTKGKKPKKIKVKKLSKLSLKLPKVKRIKTKRYKLVIPKAK